MPLNGVINASSALLGAASAYVTTGILKPGEIAGLHHRVIEKYFCKVKSRYCCTGHGRSLYKTEDYRGGNANMRRRSTFLIVCRRYTRLDKNGWDKRCVSRR